MVYASPNNALPPSPGGSWPAVRVFLKRPPLGPVRESSRGKVVRVAPHRRPHYHWHKVRLALRQLGYHGKSGAPPLTSGALIRNPYITLAVAVAGRGAAIIAKLFVMPP